MEVRVSGPAGWLRVGYQVAAELGEWTLELVDDRPRDVRRQQPQPRRYRLAATLRSLDRYWATQEPLALWLVFGSAVWAWPTVTVTIMDDERRIAAAIAGVPQVR